MNKSVTFIRVSNKKVEFQPISQQLSPTGQVIMKDYLLGKKIYLFLMTGQHFFGALIYVYNDVVNMIYELLPVYSVHVGQLKGKHVER